MRDAIHIRLEPETIALGNNGLLRHQEETVKALSNHPAVFNCAMTGAGKTKAAHLAIKTHCHDKPVLFIAPTNALVSQHLDDARAFVKENGLPHHVVAVDGEILYNLQRQRSSIYRPSEVLHQLIYNPREFARELDLDNSDAPIWMITNPDQIWLSIVKGRGIDTRNLLKDFINHFRFVVVDEFHYYSAEQLTLFFLCISFWKHFDQFDDGLKMLLLTATPDEVVYNFFQRMDIHICTVKDEGDSKKAVAVLAPVELTLAVGDIHDFREEILSYYNEGKDGVVISDSLLDINRAYQIYKGLKIEVGRITGPINDIHRKHESKQRLILATPTVDLGFNFNKPRQKKWQEIDFLVATAKTKSAFWQRLGRTGRVLGKKETQIPSTGTMLLPNFSCFKRLEEFNGHMITRKRLNELLDLRDKKLKGHALTREGLYTATRQLVEVEKMLPDEHKHIAEKIFSTIRDCFDPHQLTSDWPSYKKRHWLSSQLKSIDMAYPVLKPYHIRQFLKNSESPNRVMEILLGAWAKNHFYREGKLQQYNEYIKENSSMSLVVALLKKKQSLKQEVVEYQKAQMLRLDYLFGFRGSSVREDVWIYDPQRLHSSELICKIDIIYLFSKYVVQGPLPQSLAEKQWNIRLPKVGIFFEITDFYEYPYRPIYQYDGIVPSRLPKPDQPQSEELLPVYWQTVALHDLSIVFRNNKVGLLTIPAEIKSKLTGLSELFFITPIENQFILSNWLKEYDVQTGVLKTDDGEHAVVYGKDAIFISEELYYRGKENPC